MGHSIRLREPWHGQVIPPGGSLGAPPPDEYLLQFSRSFNAPTGLTPEQQVEIEISLRPDARLLSASLNGQPLVVAPGAAPASLRFDIRGWLQPANQLQLTLGLPPTAIALPQTLASFAEVSLQLGDD